MKLGFKKKSADDAGDAAAEQTAEETTAKAAEASEQPAEQAEEKLDKAALKAQKKAEREAEKARKAAEKAEKKLAGKAGKGEKVEKKPKQPKQPKKVNTAGSAPKGGPQQIMAEHGEKMALALVIAVFGFLIYSGYQVKGLEKNDTPTTLEQLVDAARTHANEDMSTDVMADRPAETNYRAWVDESRRPTDPTLYSLQQPWAPLPPSRKIRRADPELLAPVKIEVTSVFASLATKRQGSEVDAIAELPPAPPRKVEAPEAPRPRPRPRTRRPRGGESGEYMPYDASEAMGGSPDSGEGSPYMPYPGSGDGNLLGSVEMGGMPGMMGAGRTLLEKYTRGFYKSGGGGAMGGYGGGAAMPGGEGSYNPYGGGGSADGASAGSPIVPRTLPFNAVKVLYPLEKLAQIFEQTLQDALGHNQLADQPRIIYFEAQRVDVTADPDRQPDEAEWKTVTNTSHQYSLQQKFWAGSATDIIDPKYYDPTITMPVPPVLMTKLEPIALHSETEKMRRGPVSPQGDQEKTGDETGEQQPLDLTDPGAMPGPGVGPGQMTPGQFNPGAMVPGQMTPGQPGMPGYPGAPGAGYPGAPGAGYPGAPGAGMMPGGEGSYAPQSAEGSYGMMPGAGMMPGGEGSGMYGGYGMGQPMGFPEYKLVRFYDFGIVPGRVYRYRVRLWIEDPNRPQNPAVAPPAQMLEDAVALRVRQVEAEDATKENYRTYWRTTDWCEASDAAGVEVPSDLFVGSVTQPTMASVNVAGKSEVEIPRRADEEAEGDLVALLWGGRYGQLATNPRADTYPAMIPGEHKVRRGTVLNFTTNAEIVHPMTHEIKQLENYDFKMDAVVVDLRGGEVLPNEEKKDKPLTAPGEFAVIDADGNFIVRNELDTIEGFRMRTFADETEAAMAAAQPSMGYPGGAPGMAPGEGQIPGMEGSYDAMMGTGGLPGDGPTRRPRRPRNQGP
ncbi:MAG: hypothetical protein KDA62_07405 [Planctomycetales bacterium]|nr:hypothetical protein [Planctomycetales bacterium]